MSVAHAIVAAAGEGCFPTDLICIGGKVIETVANKGLSDLATAFMNGWQQMEMWFFASWIAVPLLVDITNPDGVTFWLSESLSYLTFFFAVLGVLIAAGVTFLRLGWENIKNLGWRFGVLLLVTLAGAPFIALLDRLSRSAAMWLLAQVGIDANSSLINNQIAAVAAPIVIILAIIAVLGLIVQWGIMIARGAITPVLVAAWPLAASAALIKGGEGSFNAISRWLLAFVIYPFPAAIVYAAAFRFKTGQDGIGGIMYGFVLEMLAVFLLPAIMRILAPSTQALGKAYGGEIAVKTTAALAETAVAVGAAVVTAGAAAGFLGAKAGAAGAKAAASTANGASTASSGRGTAGAAGSSGSGPGGSGSGSGSGGGMPAGDDGFRGPGGAGGAENVKAGDGAADPGAPGARPPASDRSSNGRSNPDSGGRRPAPAPQPAGNEAGGRSRGAEPSRSGQGPLRRDSSAAARAQASAHVAQAASSRVGNTAREALNDADEIVGGKNG